MPARRAAAMLLAAAFVFCADMARPSLPSLDDCYYARKGVEMGRSGRVFTVTWNGQPTFQNPPLQFWILGRSFAALGENDAAARLPSALMALAIAAAVYRIGLLTLGPQEALTALALLLATPIFVNNARRCMLEVPLTLWVTLTVLVFVAGRERPRLHLLLALPLGAALLTKSVLGLLPLGVMAGAMIDARARAGLRRPWLWLGLAGGLALGAAWPLHQWLTIGSEAVREHFVGEVLGKSTQAIPVWRRVAGYPLLLLERYHPPVLPAFAGLVLIWTRWRSSRDGRALAIAAWILVPLAVFAASSAQSLRYIFPVLPALALAGGLWLAMKVPRVARALQVLVPALLAAAAVVFWLRPGLLTQPGNDVLKASGDVIRAQTDRGEPVTYVGGRYWNLANPVMYYAERLVEMPRPTFEEAVLTAVGRPSRLLLLDDARLPDLVERRVPHVQVLKGPDWTLVRIHRGARRALEGRPPL